jgi:hypothetical protein
MPKIISVISETEQEFELKYLDEETIWVHKSLIYDNHYAIVDNKIEISDALFKHFFRGYLSKLALEEKVKVAEMTFAFLEKIPFLIENLDYIRSKKEYYHLYFDYVRIGHFVVFSPGLGGLLESYQSESDITGICSISGGRYYIISGGGSPFSGSGSVRGYCMGCECVHTVGVGFQRYMKEFHRIVQFCPPIENEEVKKRLRAELNL